MTNYIHRTAIIIPKNLQKTFNQFFKENIDLIGGENTFTVPLISEEGGEGEEPTHYWCNTSLTESQLKALTVFICDLSNLTFSDFDSKDRLYKKNWFISNAASLKSLGISIVHSNNDEVWEKPEDSLKGMDLKVKSDKLDEIK